MHFDQKLINDGRALTTNTIHKRIPHNWIKRDLCRRPHRRRRLGASPSSSKSTLDFHKVGNVQWTMWPIASGNSVTNEFAVALALIEIITNGGAGRVFMTRIRAHHAIHLKRLGTSLFVGDIMVCGGDQENLYRKGKDRKGKGELYDASSDISVCAFMYQVKAEG